MSIRFFKMYLKVPIVLLALVEAALLIFAPYLAAGLHVMVFPEAGVDEARLVREAAARGVRVHPGAPYHLERPAPPSILLGFSGLSEAEIIEGVRRLAEAWPAAEGV